MKRIASTYASSGRSGRSKEPANKRTADRPQIELLRFNLNGNRKSGKEVIFAQYGAGKMVPNFFS